MELYVNNIFVHTEIHDIYISRIGFTLIRIYHHHKERSHSADQDERHLSQLKWPVEYMMIGLHLVWNDSKSNPLRWRDRHKMGQQN